MKVARADTEGYWDGIVRLETLTEHEAQLRQRLADAAKRYEWPRVLEMLSQRTDLVNATRPGGKSLYTPLHQAAYGGASVSVVESLVQLGAFRTLRNADGDRAVDIAEKRSHAGLTEILRPALAQVVPPASLSQIQKNFHTLIMERAARLVNEHTLRLPELEPLLEFALKKFWFQVPGMYGGFKYWLAYAGSKAKLIAESWCRVAGGSGQLHEITAEGYVLVDEGFV